MKSEVPGPRSGISLSELWTVGNESALVKSVNDRLVETEIINNGETVIRRQINRVRVRALLPFRVCAVAGVLHKRRSFAKPAVLGYGEYRHAAAGVVGDQNIFPGFVDDDVAGICAFGSDLIYKRQFACHAINHEGADGPTLLAF